jgi:hypothetical protein
MIAGTSEPFLMEPHQQKVFEMFVHLGPERSLTKLLAICNDNGISVGEATLKRWSSKFKWQDLVTRTEQEISNRIANEAMPMHVRSMAKDLDVIEQLKEDFRERVKNKEIKVDTLADYALLLKIEASITGDPTKRKDHEGDTTINNDNRVEINFTPDQMTQFLQFEAQQKHGLPPAPTYDHDD